MRIEDTLPAGEVGVAHATSHRSYVRRLRRSASAEPDTEPHAPLDRGTWAGFRGMGPAKPRQGHVPALSCNACVGKVSF